MVYSQRESARNSYQSINQQLNIDWQMAWRLQEIAKLQHQQAQLNELFGPSFCSDIHHHSYQTLSDHYQARVRHVGAQLARNDELLAHAYNGGRDNPADPYNNASVDFLGKIANSLGYDLHIQMYKKQVIPGRGPTYIPLRPYTLSNGQPGRPTLTLANIGKDHWVAHTRHGYIDPALTPGECGPRALAIALASRAADIDQQIAHYQQEIVNFQYYQYYQPHYQATRPQPYPEHSAARSQAQAAPGFANAGVAQTQQEPRLSAPQQEAVEALILQYQRSGVQVSSREYQQIVETVIAARTNPEAAAVINAALEERPSTSSMRFR